MNLGAVRDHRKRQAVADMDLGVRSVHDGHAVCQTFRRQDVALLAVCVADQCDVSCAVRIILDTDDLCRDSVFLSSEIYLAVFSANTAASVADCDLALVVAS